jgi:hypothetical protein
VLRCRLLVFLLLISMCVTDASSRTRQTLPDLKRQKQIREALVLHGYAPGRNWTETVQVLKQIAREHHWQFKHAPDARVLILLGLGNKYSDPAVLALPS